jgi:hypothetical protein
MVKPEGWTESGWDVKHYGSLYDSGLQALTWREALYGYGEMAGDPSHYPPKLWILPEPITTQNKKPTPEQLENDPNLVDTTIWRQLPLDKTDVPSGMRPNP